MLSTLRHSNHNIGFTPQLILSAGAITMEVKFIRFAITECFINIQKRILLKRIATRIINIQKIILLKRIATRICLNWQRKCSNVLIFSVPSWFKAQYAELISEAHLVTLQPEVGASFS